jgi:hypothetical protein
MFESWPIYAHELTKTCSCRLIASMNYNDDTCASTALSLCLNRVVNIDNQLALVEFCKLYNFSIVFQGNYWQKQFLYATEGDLYAEKAFIIDYTAMVDDLNAKTMTWQDSLILSLQTTRQNTIRYPLFNQLVYFCILYDEYLYPSKHCIVIKTINNIHHIQDPLLRSCFIITETQRSLILQSSLTVLSYNQSSIVNN